jgi:hypothetical protein
MIRSILTTLACLVTLGSVSAETPAKKEEPILLPAQVVRGIQALNAEAKRRYDRDRKFIEKEKKVTLQSILKTQFNNHITSLREKLEEEFTAAEKKQIERALKVYERRLKDAEKTGEWKWDDLDVPTKALPKE